MEKTMLFIPDISGFTKFVNETEIEHGKMIITALLETIIKKNELNLEISEIEGDAILFYKYGSPPDVVDIIRQSKEMFIDFHKLLENNSKKMSCNCGACVSAPNLTLKFVSHFGESKTMRVHTFEKLIGNDIILAHRLLKNRIPDKEYILLTDDYLKNSGDITSLGEDWAEPISHNEEIEDFGDITLNYIKLKPLYNFITN